MSQIVGHISQVIGPVVDVFFESTGEKIQLPSIHEENVDEGQERNAGI